MHRENVQLTATKSVPLERRNACCEYKYLMDWMSFPFSLVYMSLCSGEQGLHKKQASMDFSGPYRMRIQTLNSMQDLGSCRCERLSEDKYTQLDSRISSAFFSGRINRICMPHDTASKGLEYEAQNTSG